MVDIWPFHGTRPYNQDAKTLIAPSTDHLSIENIEIFRKNNYWNYLTVLNPVGQLKEKDSLTEAREHFNEMKDNDVIKKDSQLNFYIYQIELGDHKQLGFLSLASVSDFEKNIIKPHEKIYQSRKVERADQMMNIKTQIGPIYVSYPSDKNLSNGAIREAKEESGLQINSLELLGKVSFDNFDMFFYFSDDYSGEVEINDESQDFKWVDIFDLENYKFPMGKLNKKLINSLMNIVGEKNE